MQNQTLKLIGNTILTTLRILLLFLIPVFLLVQYFSPVLPIPFTTVVIVAGAVEGLLFFAGKKLDASVMNIRNAREFDENGLSRKYNEYQKLSKKEREEVSKQRLAEVERLIGTGTLKKITKEGSKNPEKDLKELLGLKEVKDQVAEMSARMEFDKKYQKNKRTINISSHHMCFIGPPGTGKTTLAKIMTGFLYRYGYIKVNKYIETDGNFLRGQTPGETSQKTSLLLSMAKGKVLFIDEAYALFSGPGAQEAIASIIKVMEDSRDEFILILAGYEHEMEQLIHSNPGFFSRIGHILHFNDYTNEELYKIFISMAKKYGFLVAPETIKYFMLRIQEEKKKEHFGNARTCRNILDESISHHALNLKKKKLKPEYRHCIYPIDLNPQLKYFRGDCSAQEYVKYSKTDINL